MHPLLFAIKRVFLCSTRIAWDYATEFELTPARYDMLIAIAHDPSGIAQKELGQVLGVSKPVICRMLRLLEGLRLVSRHPHPSNDRWRWVRLTDEGRETLLVAQSELMGPHSLVDDFVQSMVTRTPRDFRERRLGYAAATKVTEVLRARLEDRATLRYPLYPGPGEPWPPLTSIFD